MLIHQIGGCQQTAENCQIQLNALAQLTSSHGKKSWDGQKSGRMICRLEPQFPLHHVLRNVGGGWVRTPTEPAGISALWTHRDFCGMFFPWIHQPWGMLGKASHPHVGPDRAHVLSLASHPLRFQTCLGGIYRCRVGIVQSTSANVNSNYVKKMPVAFSEEEHFSILAMPFPWIVALSQNLKTSVCRQLACSAFHGTKRIDKTTLLHPSHLLSTFGPKDWNFCSFQSLHGRSWRRLHSYLSCAIHSLLCMVRNSSRSMSFSKGCTEMKGCSFLLIILDRSSQLNTEFYSCVVKDINTQFKV